MKTITAAIACLGILLATIACDPPESSYNQAVEDNARIYVARLYPDYQVIAVGVPIAGEVDVKIQKGTETKMLYLNCQPSYNNSQGGCAIRPMMGTQ